MAIKLGARKFRLIDEPKYSAKIGSCSDFFGLLTVSKEGELSTRELTLWEEILHAMNVSLALELSHTTIKALAFGIQAVLHQNTDVPQNWFDGLYDDKDEEK